MRLRGAQIDASGSESIPTGSTRDGQAQAFVYHGQEQSFELFFLGDPPGENLFLYRSTADYPERREPGPYALVREVDGWGWYRLIPMRPVTVFQEWRGRVALNRKVLPASFVTDPDALRTLWEDWGLEEPIPDIDFERRLLLVAVVRSSLVMFREPVIDDRGDLKSNVVATPDYPAFWSYALCLIDRTGIVTIDSAPF